MSKKRTNIGSCIKCGRGCRSTFRLCSECKDDLRGLKHDLELLERFKDEKFLNEEFDESDRFANHNFQYREEDQVNYADHLEEIERD